MQGDESPAPRGEHTERMSVRLTPAEKAQLLHIARAEGIPPAILARTWIVAELTRRRRDQGTAPPDG